MGNHDDRAAFRTTLLGELPTTLPIDDVVDDQRAARDHPRHLGARPPLRRGPARAAGLAGRRSCGFPAPDGTILAMHHPPVPSVLDLAVSVELRDQGPLAAGAARHGCAQHPRRAPALLVDRDLRRHPRVGRIGHLLHPGPQRSRRRNPRSATARARSISCTSTPTRCCTRWCRSAATRRSTTSTRPRAPGGWPRRRSRSLPAGTLPACREPPTHHADPGAQRLTPTADRRSPTVEFDTCGRGSRCAGESRPQRSIDLGGTKPRYVPDAPPRPATGRQPGRSSGRRRRRRMSPPAPTGPGTGSSVRGTR